MSNDTKKSPLNTRPLPVAGSEIQGILIDKVLDFAGLFAIFAVTFGLTLTLWQHDIFGTLPNRWFMTLITIGFGVYIWKRFSKLLEDAQTYKLGRQGEITVGHILEVLRPFGYTPIHDVLCKGANKKYFNIDHVLVGPTGVFAVETKTWSKAKNQNERIIYRNGSLYAGANNKGGDALKRAKDGAEYLQNTLCQRLGKPCSVTPILTFPGWWVDENSRISAEGIIIVNPLRIGEALKTRPQDVLSAQEIKQIVDSISYYLYDIADQREKRCCDDLHARCADRR